MYWKISVPIVYFLPLTPDVSHSLPRCYQQTGKKVGLPAESSFRSLLRIRKRRTLRFFRTISVYRSFTQRTEAITKVVFEANFGVAPADLTTEIRIRKTKNVHHPFTFV
jgi:hypothetical protein